MPSVTSIQLVQMSLMLVNIVHPTVILIAHQILCAHNKMEKELIHVKNIIQFQLMFLYQLLMQLVQSQVQVKQPFNKHICQVYVNLHHIMQVPINATLLLKLPLVDGLKIVPPMLNALVFGEQ